MKDRGWARWRQALTAWAGQAAPGYGLCAAVATALPLLIAARLGRPATGLVMALGAYLVAVRSPQGTYGRKARALVVIVTVIGAGSLIGGLLIGHRWIVAVVLPAVVIFQSVLPGGGPTFGLATVTAAVRPSTDNVIRDFALEMLGALIMSALVLAPWPGRRLRPLLESLSEAAVAVAEALDVVMAPAQDPEWERRRRAAAEALRNARTTYGMYNAGSDDERPARLINALVKIMHDTVALRALVLAGVSSPLHSGAEPETRAAIAVLAARLRSLAEVIGSPAGGSWDEADSAASHRLGDRIDEIRRAAFEGREDLVAEALAAQTWRTVRRIAATIDSAGRVATAGITVGISVPRLPGAPSPTSLWSRSVTGVSIRSAALRNALRAGVAVFVATVIWAAFDIPRGYWLVISVFLCLRNTYGETVSRVFERIGGTALGGVLAAILLAVVRGETELALVIFFCAFIGFTLSPVSYVFWMCFCTPLVMLLVDFGAPVAWSQTVVRIGATIGGGVLALAAARLLWPSSDTASQSAVLARLCSALGDLVRTATSSEEALAQPLAQSREAADVLTDLAGRLAQEPSPDTELIGCLREAVAVANRIRDQVIAVAGMSRAEQGEMGPVSSILIQVADHLEEVAGALESGDASLPTLDIDDLLADLDGYLSSLAKRRRAEVAGETAVAESTPLRQDLLSVAAVRHALRGLHGDVRELDRVLYRCFT
jgi:uncharacterized membrane protein YccC